MLFTTARSIQCQEPAGDIFPVQTLHSFCKSRGVTSTRISPFHTVQRDRRVCRVKSSPTAIPPGTKLEPQRWPRRIHRTVLIVGTIETFQITAITRGNVSNFQLIPAAAKVERVKVHSDAIAAWHCDAPLTTAVGALGSCWERLDLRNYRMGTCSRKTGVIRRKNGNIS